ncbi:hypothetical protein BV372_06865 [Nostoc sp. T09]|uniref:hypothetical protein n=1 Tax=Nostoc sp. T09 TaxID=1932621 RepID=UPI000A3A8F2C|nr:hypothetical protein [Nostoc sp. T09]OUL36571.1 hypothetical protein BV372_06865 [Nostoc sp. T09]
MLSPTTPFWGLPCNVPRYWRLRVAKDFKKPEYYLGQTVIHMVEVPRKGEFLVDVIGLSWTGQAWQYEIQLPDCHPWFKKFDQAVEWALAKELKLP